MLTLILLVILGGGVGILAVSMAEAKPAMRDDGQRRARTPATPTPESADEPVIGPDTDPVDEPVTPPVTPPATQTRQTPVPATTPAPRPAPTRAPVLSTPRTVRRTTPGLPRQVERGSIPAAQTAVEGPLHDLVRPSIPRRVFSLVGIVVIAVVIGVGIAALLGAVVGGAAEIVGNTIG